MSTHWSVDDIPWDDFRADLVDKELVKIVKAAALVESNADDYASYLCNVFHGDPDDAEARPGLGGGGSAARCRAWPVGEDG